MSAAGEEPRQAGSGAGAGSGEIVIAGWISYQPGDRDAALAAFDAMAAASLREHGCLAYSVTADRADPTRVRIIEHWSDAEALQRHFTMDHMATFREQTGALVPVDRDLQRMFLAERGPMPRSADLVRGA